MTAEGGIGGVRDCGIAGATQPVTASTIQTIKDCADEQPDTRAADYTGDCADALDAYLEAGGCTSECVLAFRSKDARSIACAAADTEAACLAIVAPCEGSETGATASTLPGVGTVYCSLAAVLAAAIITSTFGF